MIDLKKPDQRTPLRVIAKTSPRVTGNTTAATVQITVLRNDMRKCGSTKSSPKLSNPMKTGSVMPSKRVKLCQSVTTIG